MIFVFFSSRLAFKACRVSSYIFSTFCRARVSEKKYYVIFYVFEFSEQLYKIHDFRYVKILYYSNLKLDKQTQAELEYTSNQKIRILISKRCGSKRPTATVLNMHFLHKWFYWYCLQLWTFQKKNYSWIVIYSVLPKTYIRWDSVELLWKITFYIP